MGRKKLSTPETVPAAEPGLALSRGLAVLSCFQRGDQSLTNNDIAERCSLARSTVSRITATLTQLGYLNQDPKTGQYRIGPAALAFGAVALSMVDVREIAGPTMQEIAEIARGSVAMAIYDAGSMVYIAFRRSMAPVALTVDVGSRIALTTTSAGRAFLAACTPAEREPILAAAREADVAGWAGTQSMLAASMAEYDRSGCCTSLGDWHATVNALAVGFRPRAGMLPMALICGGPSFLLSPEVLLTQVRPRLLGLAARLDGTMDHVTDTGLPSRVSQVERCSGPRPDEGDAAV